MTHASLEEPRTRGVMRSPQNLVRTLLASLLALASSGCPSDDGNTSGAAATEITATIMTNPGASVDETGTLAGPCDDDYDGNHEAALPHVLGLDTTDTARAILGDQVIGSTGNEQGGDRLVVCPERSDFFAVDPSCAGYLGIDVRRLDEGEIDVYLYAGGVEVDRAGGTWNEFFLKPIHRSVIPQRYIIEVRHAAGDVQPYSLETYVLPTVPCP